MFDRRPAPPAPHPPTPQVTGMVETKLLDKKVAAVEEQVTKIARTELHGALPPQLARISKTTAIARTSMTGANLARTSTTQIMQQVGEIEASLFTERDDPAPPSISSIRQDAPSISSFHPALAFPCCSGRACPAPGRQHLGG